MEIVSNPALFTAFVVAMGVLSVVAVLVSIGSAVWFLQEHRALRVRRQESIPTYYGRLAFG